MSNGLGYFSSIYVQFVCHEMKRFNESRATFCFQQVNGLYIGDQICKDIQKIKKNFMKQYITKTSKICRVHESFHVRGFQKEDIAELAAHKNFHYLNFPKWIHY